MCIQSQQRTLLAYVLLLQTHATAWHCAIAIQSIPLSDTQYHSDLTPLIHTHRVRAVTQYKKQLKTASTCSR
jgi:hypothetical protein